MTTHHIGLGIWAVLAALCVAACRAAAISMENGHTSAAPLGSAAPFAGWALLQSAVLGAGGAVAAWQGDSTTCAVMAGSLAFVAGDTAAKTIFVPLALCRIVLLLLPMAVMVLATGTAAMAALAGMIILTMGFGMASARRTGPLAIVELTRAASRRETVSPNTMFAATTVGFQAAFGRDSVTGLANKPRFLHVVEQEGQRAALAASPLSLLLVLCEGYDGLVSEPLSSDTQAHAVRLTKHLQSALWRPGDLLASFGDGRFAVLLPFTDAMGCDAVARKLQTSASANARSANNVRDDKSTSSDIARLAGC